MTPTPDRALADQIRTHLTAAGLPPHRCAVYSDRTVRLLYRDAARANTARLLLVAAGYGAILTDRPSPNTYGVSAVLPSVP